MESETKVSVPGLFCQFFKIGCFTFGGGWSIVAQIRKEYVEKRGWLTDTDLLEITSVGRSLPGIMIGNVSYLFGYHVAGFPGALVCLLGLALPSLIILTLVTWGYTMLQDNVYVSRAMVGVRAAVVPIMLSAALTMWKAAMADKLGWLFLLVALFLYLLFDVNCLVIVLLCGLLGFLICTWRQRRKGADHGPS